MSRRFAPRLFPFDVRTKRATEQQIRQVLWTVIDQSSGSKLTATLIADLAHERLGPAAHPMRLKRIAARLLKTGFTRRRGFEP